MMENNVTCLFDDAISRSSSPHLFLDNSSSCNSSDAATGFFSNSESLSNARGSTPHIFLSYAKPNPLHQCHCPKKILSFVTNKEQNNLEISSSELFDLPLYTKTRTAHQHQQENNGFSAAKSQRTEAGQETCESRPSDSLDWKDLSNMFQHQCHRYMTEQHDFSENHAITVSSALGKAMLEAASHYGVSSSFKNDSLTNYATMIHNCFTQPKESTLERNYDSRPDDSLSETCRQQEQELRFLRAALKETILCWPQVEACHHPPSKMERKAREMITSPGPQQQSGDGEIPTSIQFVKDTIILDPQHPEEHSELTPSEGDFLLEIAALVQPKSLLSSFGIKNRTAKPIHQAHTRIEYPELEKGETRGQHTRCMDFFLYLNDLESLLRGKYSGKVSLETGLPHGKGVFRFDNRDVYMGDFADGMMHGEGCLFTRRNKRLLKLRGTYQHNDFFGDGSLLKDSMGNLNACI
ncbi:MORN repeat-containing protein [Nitzschia inconspicua]|uniref:MORN repeat-containing protein n=1 Tax=Nitzschia inconspicua TaxID=303405 RepID=A0A9K3L612_9STRA|nr:MORN repeat-containing protein [Nitzschia inconspicua]